jgi:GNAT superfamily N-acetyltransferase
VNNPQHVLSLPQLKLHGGVLAHACEADATLGHVGEIAPDVDVQLVLGEENGVGRLRFFFVEPFTRGKGVGRLVFTTAMDMAKEMGYNHLYFSTYNVLKPARNMYRSLGFVITKETPEDEVLPGAVEEIWEKDI